MIHHKVYIFLRYLSPFPVSGLANGEAPFAGYLSEDLDHEDFILKIFVNSDLWARNSDENLKRKKNLG